MRRFSLLQLLSSATFIALGCGVYAFLVHPHQPPLTLIEAHILLWPAGSLLGAGVLCLYRRPVLGAIVGAIVGPFIQYAILLAVAIVMMMCCDFPR
jgi:hypothetical protein